MSLKGLLKGLLRKRALKRARREREFRHLERNGRIQSIASCKAVNERNPSWVCPHFWGDCYGQRCPKWSEAVVTGQTRTKRGVTTMRDKAGCNEFSMWLQFDEPKEEEVKNEASQ